MPAMLIYKIFRPAEWTALQDTGETTGSPVDRRDGFVHFSTAKQLPETLRRHFSADGSLILLACDAAAMGETLRWEASRGGDLFPHLYRSLQMTDILWTKPVPRDAEGHHTGLLE